MEGETWSAKDKSFEEIQKLYGKRKDKLLAKDSKAESHFESLLKQQPYFYIREKAFMDDGFLCYVDFYIPKFGLAIEIDGPEHNSPKGKYRDEKKTRFLLSRGRVTHVYRITNDECLQMTSIDIAAIAKYLTPDWIWRNFVNHHKEMKPKWIELMQSKTTVDLWKPIYAYSKRNDVVYSFSDAYELKESIFMTNKDIFKNLSGQVDYMQATNFIFAEDADTLNMRIEQFKDKQKSTRRKKQSR